MVAAVGECYGTAGFWYVNKPLMERGEIVSAGTRAEANAMEGKDFNGLLGTLLYACCMTRPDIAFYTAYLCQFMQAPSVEAWEAALSIASYLYSTKNLGISFHGWGAVLQKLT